MSVASRVAGRIVPAAVLVALGPGALPAGAIGCGKAVPAVERLTFAPAARGWQATVVVVDYDGGGPLSTLDVRLRGASRPAYTRMAAATVPGTYTLALPHAVPGLVEVDIASSMKPGGGIPVTSRSEHLTATLKPGRTVTLTGTLAYAAGRDDPMWGVAALAIPALAAVYAAALWARRRDARSGP